MAKFTSSQGNFTWNNTAIQGEKIDDAIMDEIQTDTDWFSAACTDQHSNLETCTNQKSDKYNAKNVPYATNKNSTDRTNNYDPYASADKVYYRATNLSTRYTNNLNNRCYTMYSGFLSIYNISEKTGVWSWGQNNPHSYYDKSVFSGNFSGLHGTYHGTLHGSYHSGLCSNYACTSYNGAYHGTLCDSRETNDNVDNNSNVYAGVNEGN